MFVDHATSFVFIYHQVSLAVGNTLVAKHQFELFAHTFSIKIQSYHADNVPFDNACLQEDIQLQGQSIKFSGVGAHHQNGVAERAICTITQWARAMLLHQILMWPDRADTSLWPFALSHAVWLWNNMPNRRNQLTPIELFSKQCYKNYDHLWCTPVWGCPTYVLDPHL